MVVRLLKRRWSPPEVGAAPVVRLISESGTGRYFNVEAEERIPDSPELVERLWRQARELTGGD